MRETVSQKINTMNSTSYQTFEYVPPDEPDSDSNQFYVVQDDGTYFPLNRQIQYVTQVQDVNEVLQGVEPCTVYDVTPQQYYVDNNTEFASSTDEFILPENGNNFYPQNFLLQQISNAPDEQMEQDANEPIAEAQTQELVEENPPFENNGDLGSCTEITLTDEQYQLLEKKGWILLESNEKVYVLDNMGLHDITTNEKLIEKLKSEMQADVQDEKVDSNKSEEVSECIENDEPMQVMTDQGSFLIKEDINKTEEIETKSETETVCELPNEHVFLVEGTDGANSANEQINNSAIKPVPSSITIKTNYVFKDIPEKIILGKTASGKNLIAKVVNKVAPPNNPETNNVIEKSKNASEKKPVFFGYKSAKHLELNTGLSESTLEKLITIAVKTRTHKDYEKRAAEVEPVIVQLLQIPSFKPAIMERNLLVTKISKNADRTEKITSEGRPMLVTGKLVILDDQRPKFIALPYVLQNLMKSKTTGSSNFTHVHISETKIEGGGVKNSIIINKKNIRTDATRTPPQLKFACSACASVYTSKQALDDHRMTGCIDSDGDLMIDMNVNETSNIQKSTDSKRTTYTCTLCSAEFLKLNNCQRHMKTHQAKQENEDSEIQNTNQSSDNVYKCNLCPASFLNSTTLSRHILNKHIIKSITN